MRTEGASRIALRLFRPAFCALLYVIVTSVAVNTFLSRWGFRGEGETSYFQKLLTHTASRPYVFRVLTPAVINALSPLVPDRVVQAIVRVDEGREDPNWPTYSARKRFNWGKQSTAAHFLAYGIVFGTLLGTLLVLRRLTRDLAGASALFVDVAPAMACLFLPLTFGRGGYIYDFPELLFCSLCLFALLQRRWGLHYVCYGLACLNKEADVLLWVLFAALWARRMPWRSLLAHSALHGAIALPILVWERIAFAANPGFGVEFHLWDNLRFWFSIRPWVTFWDVYSPLLPAPRPFNVLVLFLAGILILRGWARKPPELRAAFLALSAVLAPLLLAFGFHDEVRNLSLVFPVFYLLACQGMLEMAGERIQPVALPVADSRDAGSRDAA